MMLCIDEECMRLALDLAELGRGYTSPNPMVGGVIVKDGKVVGRGYHERAGGSHAEVNAIRDAGESANGSTLYVTLEPCNHVGCTPPCTEAIIKSGIRRVVVAMEDPNPDVIGNGNRFLSNYGIEVVCGVLREDAKRLNEFFIHYVTTKRPFVILKCASTLDGQIATLTGDSKWITNEESRGFVHELRHAVDAVMVGIGTVMKDDPQLTTRLVNKMGRNPLRIVLDTHLTISPYARLLNDRDDSGTLIVTGEDDISPEKKQLLLSRPGVEIMPCKSLNGMIDLEQLMPKLGARGITSLLIEGGSRVNASLLAGQIVNKVCLFFAPKIFGGNDGVPLFKGAGAKTVSEAFYLKKVSTRRFKDDLMIEGYVYRNN
ncbi:MAG: bifunctional diaminohydroxyphosphoribosylaminopyrimidine deaminase/5-amino-6-(5-phosphoribosylamino)uracil reductase RibD [Pseudomonadota bacterium]